MRLNNYGNSGVDRSTLKKMSYDVSHPNVALPYCSSYFLMKRYRKMSTLIEVGSSKILKEWKIVKCEENPSICMDTERNVLDPKVVSAVMMIDGKLSMMKDRNIEPLSKPTLEFDHFVGIFDGHVLMATPTSEKDYIYQLVDLSGKQPQKSITLDRKILKQLFHCYIPCEDVSDRKYSLNGLFYGCNFFLFNRETRDFEQFALSDESMFFSFESSSTYSESHSNIPYKEGNSVRSFFSADHRLIEIFFDKDMKSLKADNHLPWINDIIPNSIVPTQNSGIIFFGSEQVYCYRPGSLSNIHEGKYQKSATSYYGKNGDATILWSEDLKSCLFYIDLKCEEVVKVDLNSSKWLPYWSKEEIQKEFAFKTHQMESHPKISLLTKKEISSAINFRGEHIYKIKESARMCDFQIVCGIKCKEIFPELCSENYQEIDVKEFSNHLGAPIYRGNNEYEFGYVLDVIDGKVHVAVYSNKYHSYRIEKLPQNPNRFFTKKNEEAFGIVEPRSGIWKVKQLKLSGGARQVLIYNYEYSLDNSNIRTDWETPGHIFDEDFDNFDMEIKHGWHVSAIVGLDHGIGFIDGDKYEDNNLFKNTNQESLEWKDAILQIMAENQNDDCTMFPFGVYSSTAIGDGIYPCLYKLDQGKVVAVKVAFERYGNPRFH